MFIDEQRRGTRSIYARVSTADDHRDTAKQLGELRRVATSQHWKPPGARPERAAGWDESGASAAVRGSLRSGMFALQLASLITPKPSISISASAVSGMKICGDPSTVC